MKHSLRVTVIVAALSGAATSHVVQAQSLTFGVAGSVASTKLTLNSAQRTVWGGLSAGVDGRVGVGPGRLQLLYNEGRLTAGGLSATFVEGMMLLGVSAADAFTVTAGPHIRVRATDAERIRETMLRVGGRYEVDVLRATRSASSARAFIEGWAGLSRNADAVVGVPRRRGGGGGSAGLLVRVRRFDLRIGYAIDEGIIGDAAERQTVETVSLSLGFVRG